MFPARKIDETYWSVDRIKQRLGAYQEGVEARLDNLTLGVNPYELNTEQWLEWREGWLEARMYETGGTKSYFFVLEPEEVEDGT